MPEHIYLTGLPGCGKSTLGRRLAKVLGLPFADLDELITGRIGIAITDYFAQYGEAAFRDVESQALLDSAGLPPSVIATGGGIVLRQANREALRGQGRVIYVRRAVSGILPYVGGGERPLLAGDAQARLLALEAARAALYEVCAQDILENQGTPEQALSDLLALLQASHEGE